MDLKGRYRGQNTEAETKLFDSAAMVDGYNTYQEETYKKFFELSGLRRNARKKLKLLEIGCGSGEIGRRLAAMGYMVTGVDLSKTLVKQANALAKKNNLPYRALAGDIFDYKAKGYDVVLCAGILHHFQDLRPIANKLGCFVKKTGEIIIFEPNGSNIMIKFSEFIRKKVWPFKTMHQLGTPNETNHDVKRYIQSFVSAGYSVKSSDGFLARTRFDNYGFFMNVLLLIKYLLQDLAAIFMESAIRGTVIVMRFQLRTVKRVFFQNKLK